MTAPPPPRNKEREPLRFGLFADSGPLACQLLAAINARMPESGRIFPLSGDGSRLSIEADALSCDGIDLSALDAVWIYGFPYQNPVVPAVEPHRDWSLWQFDHLVEQQTYSALFSLFQELDRRGVRVINTPRVHIGGFTRFALLERLRRHGLQVPPLLCTNDPSSVDAFRQHHGDLVWRPTAGVSRWQRFLAKQQADLVDPSLPPILLAPSMAGPLNMSYVSRNGGGITVQHRAPSATPSGEELEQFWTVANLPVPDLDGLFQVVGGYWLKISHITNPSGNWIYDVDTDPVLTGLPEVFRRHLLTMIAEEMIGQGRRPESPTDAARPQERSNMFLRRMLRILFDMENSKYS